MKWSKSVKTVISLTAEKSFREGFPRVFASCSASILRLFQRESCQLLIHEVRKGTTTACSFFNNWSLARKACCLVVIWGVVVKALV